MVGFQFWVLFVCVILSAFFSAAETALTSLSAAKTKQLLQTNKRGMRGLNLWLNRPNRVLITLLVGDNLVNILATAIATVMSERIFGNFAVSITTGIMTLVLLIFGEVTPKTFGRYNSTWFAPIAINLLLPFYWLLSPLVFFLSACASFFLRLAGRKEDGTEPTATQEDIAFMIRLGHQEGVLPGEEGEMLESVIEFRDTVVKEIMVPRIAICSLEDTSTFEEVLSAIRQQGHSRWPVYRDDVDNIIGVFCAKDLLYISATEQKNFRLQNYVRPALFVPDVMKIGKLLKEFKHGKAHLAIVVDEYGVTAGIVSLEGILEELVGEIRDEYDKEEPEQVLYPFADGSFEADGRANIDLLTQTLGIEFPENESYRSLAGFLITTHGKMPSIGAQIDFQGWRFTIKNANEKRIMKVQIAPIPLPDEKLSMGEKTDLILLK